MVDRDFDNSNSGGKGLKS